MKLLQLDIEGFKSLKQVTWLPGDLNVVIGPNASGKSNLLQALEMISVAAEGGLSKWVMNHGGMGALVWDGQADSIGFECELREVPSEERSVVRYRCNLQREPGQSSFFINAENLVLPSVRGPAQKNQGLRLLERVRQNAYVMREHPKKQVTISNGVLERDETLLSICDVTLGDTHTKPARTRHDLRRWLVLQHVDTGPASVVRQPFVTRRELHFDGDGRNFMNVLHTLYTTDRTFKREVNDAMSAAFYGEFDGFDFPPDAGDQRTQLRLRWKNRQREDSAADLSDGTLRFMFLISVLSHPNPPPLVAIDEPETGLHPDMFPIVTEYAAAAAEKTQVIFTTHSPHFLTSFPTGVIPTTTVASRNDGATILKTLAGKVLGKWLKNYSLGALFEAGDLEVLAS